MNKRSCKPLPESSEEIPLPTDLIDQVIGQDKAVDIVRLAAKQRRFLLLVGEPGTGKSLLGQAVAQLLEDQPLQDTLSIDNSQEKLLPKIQICPAGEGERLVDEAKRSKLQNQISERFIAWFAAVAILLVSLFYALKDEGSYTALGIGAVLLFLLYLFRQQQQHQCNDVIPKILVNHAKQNCAPFVDATGSQAGALLGDVRHDPYQSGGSETPPHRLLEAGAIHRAHGGVLFIDEISTLSMESQQSLLSAIQDKQLAIFGRSSGSSGTMVRSQPAPCDFLLVLAGNIEDIDKMHPALRSRIRGYGYEIFTNSQIPVNLQSTQKMLQFIAQEVRRDGKIPHVAQDGLQALLDESKKRSAKRNHYTTHFRDLGGLIRCAGDLAVVEDATLITARHVKQAISYTATLEEQQKIQNL